MNYYTLEIYEPGSARDVWVSFDSERPFLAISKGDLLSDATFPDARPDQTIVVAAVEHIIIDTRDGMKQKTMVYTSRSNGDPDGIRRG